MIKLTNNEKCLLMFSLGAGMSAVDTSKLADNGFYLLAKKIANNDVYVETPKEKEDK